MELSKCHTLNYNYVKVMEDQICNMDQKRLLDLVTKLYSQIIWFKNTNSSNQISSCEFTSMKSLVRYLVTKLDSKNIPVEINANGMQIIRLTTDLSLQQYGDSLISTGNWSLFLRTDCLHYYWVDSSSLKIISYFRGDVVIRTALHDEMLTTELNLIVTWHRNNI